MVKKYAAARKRREVRGLLARDRTFSGPSWKDQAFVEACEVAAFRLRAESQRVMSMSFGQASLQLKMV